MNVREFVTNLRYKVDDSGRKRYEAGMQTVRQTVERVRDQTVRSFSSMNRSFSGVAQGMGRRWESTMESLRRASSATASKINADIAGMGKSHSAMAGQVKQLVAAYAGFQTLKAGGGFVLGAASEYETAVTQLTTLVGKDKAPAVFAGIQDFAKKTPYELNEVVQMVARLEGAGFGAIGKNGKLNESMMYKLGDLAAASNKPLSELTDTILSSNRGLASMIDNFVGLAGKAEDGALSVEMFDRATGKTIKKIIQQGDKKSLMEYFMAGGTRDGIKGGMIALSKTLAGQKSTLVDTAKNLAVKFYLGFSEHTHELISRSTAFLDTLEPKLQQVGKTVGNLVTKLFVDWIPRGIQLWKQWGPLVIGIIGTVVARYAGMKAIAGGSWIIAQITKLRGLTTAMALTNLAAFAIPIAVGAAIAAIGYIGYEVWRYFTQGKGIIADLAKRFPALKQALDEYGEKMRAMWANVQPILEHIGATLMEIGETVMPLLAKAAGWLFDNVFIPLIIQSLNNVSKFLDDLTRGYEIIVPALMQAFDDWKSGMDKIWAWLEEKVPWLLTALGKVGEVAGNAFGSVASTLGLGGEGGSGGAISSAMAQYNGGMGGKLAQFAKAQAMAAGGFTSLGKCAYYVEAALEKVGIQYRGHAFELKEQLDRDKRFRRVEVSDAEMRSLPPGAITVHDRNLANLGAGKGAKYGHVEISLGNGQAASDYVGKQMEHHYAGGKRFVYIPISAQTVPVPMNGGGGSGGGGGTSVTIQQNFGPAAATPQKIKEATANGVNKGLSNAAKNTPKATS
jgi:hypothetical protein